MYRREALCSFHGLVFVGAIPCGRPYEYQPVEGPLWPLVGYGFNCTDREGIGSMTSKSQPLFIQNPFVGRKQEQKVYQHLLAQSHPWVLLITGQGGNGKSTLLRHLAEQTPQEIPVVTLNFANNELRTDPLKVLEELSWKLASFCEKRRVSAFDKALREGRDRLTELSKQMNQFINVGNEASLQGAQLDMHSTDAAAMRQQRQQVRDNVTKALYEQTLTYIPARLVLMFDTCEWLSEPEGREAGSWVLDHLLPGLYERLQARRHSCLAVLASRMQPDLHVIERQDCYSLPLPMLDQPAVEDYLIALGMEDAAMRQRIYEVTHGHALCVSIIGTLWQKQGEPGNQPFTLADLPQLQEKFNERALLEFIRDRLSSRLNTPFRELTRYGVLLRSFNLPMLQAVFPELLPEANALDIFQQLISYPYIEARGNQHYAIHDLLREIQAVEIREQQPDKWQAYHEQALTYLSQHEPRSVDIYYHAIAYDEDEGMSNWWKAVETARNRGERDVCGALLQVADDGTLELTPRARGQLAFQHGRFYYYWMDMSAALASYEQALGLFRQVGSKLGEANVRKAMGDVQQFRDEREAALASYEQALGLFRQVGDRLGEANVRKAMGNQAAEQEDYEQALQLHNIAYQLYQQIEDGYSQAVLLYYRSLVHEAMDTLQLAIEDMEQATNIAQRLGLPFTDMFRERLDKLKQD